MQGLLGLPPDGAAVHFGSNTHELVWRLLSAFLERRPPGASEPAGASSSQPLLRLLASDTEFYSATRQLNRLVGERWPCLPALPCCFRRPA